MSETYTIQVQYEEEFAGHPRYHRWEDRHCDPGTTIEAAIAAAKRCAAQPRAINCLVVDGRGVCVWQS